MKKTDYTKREEEVMTDCYNLLLNPDIWDEERRILAVFKEDVEHKHDFSRSAYRVVRDLETLSLTLLQDKKTLSRPVHDFYYSLNDFAKTELRNNEIAKGLIAASGTWS